MWMKNSSLQGRDKADCDSAGNRFRPVPHFYFGFKRRFNTNCGSSSGGIYDRGANDPIRALNPNHATANGAAPKVLSEQVRLPEGRKNILIIRIKS